MIPDDPSKRGPADRSRINVNEPYELRYSANHFGVAEEQIVDAVKTVGVSVEAVKRFLGK